jgi:serine/threonine-protein kinase RsbW
MTSRPIARTGSAPAVARSEPLAQTPNPAVTRRGMRWEAWLQATPASAGAARSIVRKAAAEAGLDGDPAWDLMVATTEAVNNAVQHGRPWPNGCVLFVTEPCPRGLRVEVTDLGTFESALEPAPLDATSGRGVQIIAALVDRFEVSNGDGRTVVRFEKHTGTAQSARNPGPAAAKDGVTGFAAGDAAMHDFAPGVRPAAELAADPGGAS